MRRFIASAIIAASVFGFIFSTAAASVLQGYQGGTGIGTATSGQQSYYLQVASTTPFLTYTLAPVSGGGSSTTITGTPGYLCTYVSTSTLSCAIASTTYYLATNPSSYIKRTDLSAGGTGLTYDNGTGAFTWTNPGYITGNQTITLTGPVTGSGATSIATTIVSPLTVNVSTTQVTSTNVTAQTLTVNQTTTLQGETDANGTIVASGYDTRGNNIVGSFGNGGLILGAIKNQLYPYEYIDSTGDFLLVASSSHSVGINTGASNANLHADNLSTIRDYQFPNNSGTFALTDIDNNFSSGQTISGNVTSTSAVITGNAKISGNLILPTITNSFLATDANGNVIATTTPGGSSTATSSFSFVIEYPNTGENDAIWIAPAAATVKACYAVNKSGGDTVTMGIGYSTSRSTATSSLTQIATSTVTATTSPASLTILNSSIAAGDPVIFWTGNASSTQFSITCSVAM